MKWSFQTEGGKSYQTYQGFGLGDIKEQPAYHKNLDVLCFGSVDGHLYAVNRKKNGSLYGKQKANYGVYATPVIYNDTVVFSSADKNIYCFDLKNKISLWTFPTSGRVFAEPTVIEDLLYCGSNDGRLYEIHPQYGEKLGHIQFTERIVNKPIYDEETKTFFVPTMANEIYAIKKQLQEWVADFD